MDFGVLWTAVGTSVAFAQSAVLFVTGALLMMHIGRTGRLTIAALTHRSTCEQPEAGALRMLRTRRWHAHLLASAGSLRAFHRIRATLTMTETHSEKSSLPADAAREVARRRTFAIISHPDAGKTTLTEKFLLYGGAVQLAGSVTARKNQRATTSRLDGAGEASAASRVSSTVLQFDYGGYRVNLLDTPGHKDFSEDTYRVLTAVDAAVMVIDAGKGIETPDAQALRGLPPAAACRSSLS